MLETYARMYQAQKQLRRLHMIGRMLDPDTGGLWRETEALAFSVDVQERELAECRAALASRSYSAANDATSGVA